MLVLDFCPRTILKKINVILAGLLALGCIAFTEKQKHIKRIQCQTFALHKMRWPHLTLFRLCSALV